MKKGALIILSAPSGAGKTTLCHKLLQAMPHQLRHSISTTTRKPRGHETHGGEYFFISETEFLEKIKKSEFAEWAKVHDHYYGTSKDFLNQTLKQGLSVLLDIDVQGAENLRQAYPKQSHSIFITPPSLQELEKRLRSRGTDSDKAIEKRLTNAKAEMERSQEFDLVLVNDDLDKTYTQLEKAITSFLKRKS